MSQEYYATWLEQSTSCEENEFPVLNNPYGYSNTLYSILIYIQSHNTPCHSLYWFPPLSHIRKIPPNMEAMFIPNMAQCSVIHVLEYGNLWQFNEEADILMGVRF